MPQGIKCGTPRRQPPPGDGSRPVHIGIAAGGTKTGPGRRHRNGGPRRPSGVSPKVPPVQRFRETTTRAPVFKVAGEPGRQGPSDGRNNRHPAAPDKSKPSCGNVDQSKEVMGGGLPAGPGPASAAARRRPPRRRG